MRKERLHNSIVGQVILFPVSIIVAILIIAIFLCFLSIQGIVNREYDSNKNVLDISLNQLQNELDQIDAAFATYLTENESYAYLSMVRETGPIDKFLGHQQETLSWMNAQNRLHVNADGVFVYFDNLDLLLFRGQSDVAVHQYIKGRLENNGMYNRWKLVEIESEYYLIKINKYNNFYGGIWMPVSRILEQVSVKKDALIGEVYISEKASKNPDGRIEVYNENLCLGIVVPERFFFRHIPMDVWAIVALLFISVAIVPVLILWLRRKVVVPIRRLDEAMKAVADGDLEYRIENVSEKSANEFERLAVGFNSMVDEINLLENNLYRTKIREQKIKLKYISQMIRPHFVLNALNIVYSYRQEEFGLVKQMISYLMEYFRYIVYVKTDFVTLEKEMHHIENYLKIQKERYLDAFDYFVEWEADVSKCQIPPLIIQTFTENCLKYGKRNGEGMFVYVLASAKGERLRLMIADSGYGFDDPMLDKLQTFIRTREYQDDLGVGIQNAIERMDIIYDEPVDIRIYNALSGGAVVELLLPLEQS